MLYIHIIHKQTKHIPILVAEAKAVNAFLPCLWPAQNQGIFRMSSQDFSVDFKRSLGHIWRPRQSQPVPAQPFPLPPWYSGRWRPPPASAQVLWNSQFLIPDLPACQQDLMKAAASGKQKSFSQELMLGLLLIAKPLSQQAPTVTSDPYWYEIHQDAIHQCCWSKQKALETTVFVHWPCFLQGQDNSCCMNSLHGKVASLAYQKLEKENKFINRVFWVPCDPWPSDETLPALL